MIVTPIKTKLFKERDDLVAFITQYVKKMQEGSVLVVTSKIVALSEGRTVPAGTDADFAKLVKEESEYAIQAAGGWWLTLRDGTIIASAGIDKSNAFGKWILLPNDSYKAARELRTVLAKQYKVKKLGILITDSRLMPLRAGVVGVALGYAGFKGIRTYIGKKDLVGRKLKFSKTDIADSLATAAVLCMGEGSEQQPLALIADAPIEFTKGNPSRKELSINPADDLYRPLLTNLPKL